MRNQLEQDIIGIALQSPRDLRDLAAVRPEWFTNPVHADTWRIIQHLDANGQVADPMTVAGASHIADQASRRHITPLFLADCKTGAPYGHLGNQYGDQLREAHQRDELGAAITRAQQLLESGVTARDVRLETLDAIQAIQDENADLEKLGDTIDATVDSFYEHTAYMPTPWASLNRTIRGWRPGGLYIVGGRPGVGKSLILQQAALALSERGPVLLETLEMTPHEVNRRLLAIATSVSQQKMGGLDASGTVALSPAEQDTISRAKEKLRALPLTYGQRVSTVTDIREHARAMADREPLAGIFVDYLQLLSSPGYEPSRVQEITKFTRQLKQLAMEFDCPVIVASQLNRNSANEKRAPVLNELRDSGSIEQDADVVMLLHQDPDAAHVQDEHGTEMDLIVAKNRQGATSLVCLRKFGATATVVQDGDRTTPVGAFVTAKTENPF